MRPVHGQLPPAARPNPNGASSPSSKTRPRRDRVGAAVGGEGAGNHRTPPGGGEVINYTSPTDARILRPAGISWIAEPAVQFNVVTTHAFL